MKYLIWFLSLFLLLVVQASVLVPLHLAPVSLILIMMVSAVFTTDFDLGLIITIMGGLLLDFVSGTPDGLATMSLLGVFLVLYFVVEKILSREINQIILFTSVAGATVCYFIFFLAFNQFFRLVGLSGELSLKYILITELPLTVLFNIIFTYPVFKYYLWIQKLTHSKLTA